MTRSCLNVCCLWLALGASAPRAAAADEPIYIRVRAQSQLRLSEESRREERHRVEVGVAAVLRDGPSQAPLPDAPVILAVPALGLRYPLRTDSQGRVGLSLPLPGGSYQVTAEFPGDDLRDRAADAVRVDLSRQRTGLSVRAPEQIGLRDELSVSVELESDGEPLSGQVRLSLTTAGPRRERAVLVTGGRGAVTLPLASERGLRGGGVLTLLATYDGTLLHGPALAQARVLVTTQTEIALDPPAPPLGEVPRGGALVLTGRVSDRDEGVPLEGELVEVYARASDVADRGEAEVLGRGATDAAGRFRIRTPAVELPMGPAVVEARVVPARRHRQPSRSLALPLLVLPPEPLPVGYFLVPLLATLGFLGLWAGWRARGGLLGAWRRLRPARRVDQAAQATPEQPVASPGVRLTQRSLVSTLRRAAARDVEGVVLDAVFGGAVEVASVAVRTAGAPVRVAHTGAGGRFALGELGDGEHEVTVSAAGYLVERFVAVVPHRGEYHGVQVGLLPIRAQILRAWQRVVEPLLPEAQGEQPGAPPRGAPGQVWTPREVLGHVQGLGRAELTEPLMQLTGLVEESYYSERLSTEAMLEAAEDLSRRLAGLAPPGAARDGRKDPVAASGPR